MSTKYRVQFNELLSSGPSAHDDLIYGNLDSVQAHLDQFAWVFDSLIVTEFVGSDAVGRIVSTDEHGLA